MRLFRRILTLCLSGIAIYSLCACSSAKENVVDQDILCKYPQDMFSEMAPAELAMYLENIGAGYTVIDNPLPYHIGVKEYEWQEKTAYGRADMTAYFHNDRLYRIVQEFRKGPDFQSIVDGIGTPDAVTRTAVVEGNRGPNDLYSYVVGLVYHRAIEITASRRDFMKKSDDFVHDGDYALYLDKEYHVTQIICTYQPSFQETLTTADPSLSEAIMHNDEMQWPGFDVWIPIFDE